MNTFPCNDPILVKATIENHVDETILIDNESSVDILYRYTFRKMDLKIDSLAPSLTQLYSFIKDFVMFSASFYFH